MPGILSILIIEDDDLTAHLYQRLLEDAGYNVMTAPNAVTADMLLQGIEVNLVILDYALPDLNGMEWLHELRSNRRFAELPVILVSSIHREADLSHDRYVLFMEKPRQPQHIVTAVEHTVAQFR